MNPVVAILRLEAARELKKRSFYLMILLVLLPIVVSIILRYGMDRGINDPGFWAVAMGFKTTGEVGPFEVLNLGSWMWLIALLYGGDLLAGDLSDGTARLILSRGVRRIEYLIAKVLTVTAILTLITAATGVAAFISNAILMGGLPPWGDLPKAVALGALLGLGALPLLLVTAILGTLARKPVYGIILGFILHIVLSIAVSMYVAMKLAPEVGTESLERLNAIFLEEQFRASAYIPYHAGLYLAGMVYWVLEGGVINEPLLISMGLTLDAVSLARAYALSTIIGVVIHIVLLWRVLERIDL